MPNIVKGRPIAAIAKQRKNPITAITPCLQLPLLPMPMRRLPGNRLVRQDRQC